MTQHVTKIPSPWLMMTGWINFINDSGNSMEYASMTLRAHDTGAPPLQNRLLIKGRLSLKLLDFFRSERCVID